MSIEAITVNLFDLVKGEDFGVRFTDADADYNAVTPALTIIPPTGTSLTPAPSVSVDGTEVSFTVLGSSTSSWVTGRWQYEFWTVNGGGSRDYLVRGQFRVKPSLGAIPS